MEYEILLEVRVSPNGYTPLDIKDEGNFKLDMLSSLISSSRWYALDINPSSKISKGVPQAGVFFWVTRTQGP
jgi:hypothetical protein